MAQNKNFPLDPAELSTLEAQRIHAHVDAYLTAPELSAEDEKAAINALLDEMMPAPAPPPPPLDLPPPPPLAEWARDHFPPAAAGSSEFDSYSASPASTDGGGGKVQSPFPSSAPSDHLETEDLDDDPPDYENRYGLWHLPQPEPIIVPDDVAEIAPVDTPESAPTTSPATAAAQQSTTTKAGPTWAPAAALAALPPWLRIAIPTAVVLVIVIVAAMILTGDDTNTAPLDAPAPTAQAPAPPSAAPADHPLLPSQVEAQCPDGSSPNAGLIFGSDKSQAWICTRIYNVDNSVLTITFNQPVVVSSICVVPGFDYVEPNGEDHWDEHRLVTQILWRIGSTQQMQKINPTRGCATLTVANIAAQVITATIQKTQRPPAVPDHGGLLPGILSGPDATKVDQSFAVGHITITGRPAGGAL